jgi:hypothetical protein
VVVASGPWYSSITLWTALGSIFAFGLLSFAAWAAWSSYIAGRRQVLSYAANVQSLLPLAPEGDLDITYRGTPVESPSLVQLRIVNQSRGDIPSTAFDGGKPLGLDLGVPIVAVLSHNDHLSGAHTAAGGSTHIEIGPTLIPRGHLLTLALLISGDQLNLRWDNPLIGVDIVQEPSFKLASARASRSG